VILIDSLLQTELNYDHENEPMTPSQ